MKLLKFSFLLLTGCFLFTSCLKKKPSDPPDSSTLDPYLTVNDSLGDFNLQALYLNSGTFSRVIGDTTVFGYVIGDDRSGNIYKKIIIEDTFGGGMTIVIDRTYLYSDFPVGRKVYVKLKGLALVNYKGTPEIVYSVNSDGTTNGIPSALVSNYIIKASYPHTFTPKLTTLSELTGAAYLFCNTLIRLENMQFANNSAGVLYSDPNSSTNRYFEDCAHTGSLQSYISSYADFQPYTTPTGNGDLVGIITVYNGKAQFVVRDTTDVDFYGTRCP